MKKYDLSKLGKQSDASLAKEWGISAVRVGQLRKQHNIECFDAPANLVRDNTPSDIKYDLSRLGKEKDIELAKEWGITRERVRQLRLKNNIDKFTNNINYDFINQKIFDYLEQNTNKIIKLKDICSLFNQKYYFITKKYVKDLAKLRKIEISFENDKNTNHGTVSHRRNRCRCLICKACLAVQAWLRNNNYEIKIMESDLFVNKYFDLYELDETFGHKKFYDFMIKELDLKPTETKKS
jgi:hypothetical protein